nr:MAG: hypothetical protein 2 [Tombusviridae sp.]
MKVNIKTKSKKPRVVVQAQKANTTTQEITKIGHMLRALGGAGGSAVGNYFGAPAIGGAVGTGLGGAISKWLGQGDYTVRANSVLSAVKPDGSIPSMHRNDQSVVVRHKEFIGEITGATGFTVRNRLPINPGVSSTFPWLSAMASQYSEYRVRGMVYHYVPTSGMSVASANTALGSVMIQTSYRATEAAPASRLEMLNEYWASEGRPCDEFCHPIECDPKENPFNVQYVRSGDLPSTENVLAYDLGTTTVAVSGQQTAGTVLGDLWVTYEIELKKPKLTSATGEDANQTILVGTPNALLPFGTAFTVSKSNMLGFVPTGNSITFGAGNPGYYLVTWTVLNFTSASALTLSAISNVQGIVQPDGAAQRSAIGSSSALVSTVYQVIDATKSWTVSCSAASLVATGSTTSQVIVSRFNPTQL